MPVKELDSLGLTAISLPNPDRVIEGVYIGDLLSWVMGKATENDAWITIMSNVNVIAVASLADVSAIILAEGVTLDADIAALAAQKGINVFTTPLSAYEIATRLYDALK